MYDQEGVDRNHLQGTMYGGRWAKIDLPNKGASQVLWHFLQHCCIFCCNRPNQASSLSGPKHLFSKASAHEILPWLNIFLRKSSFLLMLFLSPVYQPRPNFLHLDWHSFWHFDLSRTRHISKNLIQWKEKPPPQHIHTPTTTTFQIPLPLVNDLQLSIV